MPAKTIARAPATRCNRSCPTPPAYTPDWRSPCQRDQAPASPMLGVGAGAGRVEQGERPRLDVASLALAPHPVDRLRRSGEDGGEVEKFDAIGQRLHRRAWHRLRDRRLV